LPELALIGGTRAALGMGLGLLLADRFAPEQRRAVGWTLLFVGALTTIPLALEVLGGIRPRTAGEWPERTAGGPRSAIPEHLGRTAEPVRG
jgi:hypothetical protein